MVLSNFTTTYQRDYSGVRAKAFRVQSARAPIGGYPYSENEINEYDRPVTRAGSEVNMLKIRRGKIKLQWDNEAKSKLYTRRK